MPVAQSLFSTTMGERYYHSVDQTLLIFQQGRLLDHLKLKQSNQATVWFHNATPDGKSQISFVVCFDCCSTWVDLIDKNESYEMATAKEDWINNGVEIRYSAETKVTPVDSKPCHKIFH